MKKTVMTKHSINLHLIRKIMIYKYSFLNKSLEHNYGEEGASTDMKGL